MTDDQGDDARAEEPRGRDDDPVDGSPGSETPSAKVVEDGAAAFAYHVFISYSTRNNQPESGRDSGWVDRFHEDLEAKLGQRIPEPPRIWQDKEKLRTGQHLDSAIGATLPRCKVFLAVLSRAFLHSKWCVPMELASFHAHGEAHGNLVVGENQSRILCIQIDEDVPEEQIPDHFDVRLRQHFLKPKKSGRRLRLEVGEDGWEAMMDQLLDSIEEVLAALPGSVVEEKGRYASSSGPAPTGAISEIPSRTRIGLPTLAWFAAGILALVLGVLSWTTGRPDLIWARTKPLSVLVPPSPVYSGTGTLWLTPLTPGAEAEVAIPYTFAEDEAATDKRVDLDLRLRELAALEESGFTIELGEGPDDIRFERTIDPGTTVPDELWLESSRLLLKVVVPAFPEHSGAGHVWLTSLGGEEEEHVEIPGIPYSVPREKAGEEKELELSVSKLDLEALLDSGFRVELGTRRSNVLFDKRVEANARTSLDSLLSSPIRLNPR